MVVEVNNKNKLVERNFKRNEMLAEYFFRIIKVNVQWCGSGRLVASFYR